MQIQFKYKYETHHLYILSMSHQRHEDGLFEYPCRTLGSRRTPRNRTARCVLVFLALVSRRCVLVFFWHS